MALKTGRDKRIAPTLAASQGSFSCGARRLGNRDTLSGSFLSGGGIGGEVKEQIKPQAGQLTRDAPANPAGATSDERD